MASLFVYIVFFSFFTVHSFSIPDDGEVMNNLLSSLRDSPPNSWNVATFYCTWTGVKCDTSARVVAISLPGRSLAGVLPPNLMFLSELKTLALQRNMLRGRLPSFANMTSLQVISLEENSFEEIAADFALGLQNLIVLTMSHNPKLVQWSLPIHLKDSNKLTTLAASNTNLIGPIPDIFDSLTKLEKLNLSNNHLAGSLPKSLTRLPHLLYIDVSNNTLSGRVPLFSSTVNFMWKGNPSSLRRVVLTTHAIVAITMMVLVVFGGVLSYIFFVLMPHQRIQTRRSTGRLHQRRGRSGR